MVKLHNRYEFCIYFLNAVANIMLKSIMQLLKLVIKNIDNSILFRYLRSVIYEYILYKKNLNSFLLFWVNLPILYLK